MDNSSLTMRLISYKEVGIILYYLNIHWLLEVLPLILRALIANKYNYSKCLKRRLRMELR